VPDRVNDQGRTTKETKKMGLVIGTFPKQRAVLPGESFLVETSIENRDTVSASVANPTGPSPFAYELLLEKDRSVRYEVSQEERDSRRIRDLPPPRDFPPHTLAVGESQQRDDDLAEMHNEDFAPGKYLIKVTYPTESAPLVSALAPVTVLVPHVESLSSEVCGTRNVLVTAYAHRREDGGVLIMQREAFTDPRENIAFRRVQLDPGPPVQVAIAIDATNAGNGRWFGWLRAGTLEAAVGWGNRVILRPPPVRASSADAILLSPGFQVDVGVALFGIVENAAGGAKVKTMRASSTGVAPAFEMDLGAQGVRNVRWNLNLQNGIAVFWQDAEGRVFRRAFDMQGKPRDAAPIATSGLVPIEWSVMPLGNPDLRTIIRSQDGRYFFRELGSGQENAARNSPVELLTLPEGAPANPKFAFCTISSGSSAIVAAGGGTIWATSVTGGSARPWQVVARAERPQYLHAFAPRDRTCWVEWLEADVGLRRAALPR